MSARTNNNQIVMEQINPLSLPQVNQSVNKVTWNLKPGVDAYEQLRHDDKLVALERNPKFLNAMAQTINKMK